jgi:hypothetical protein
MIFSSCSLAIKMGSVNVGMFQQLKQMFYVMEAMIQGVASPPLGHPQRTQHMPFDSTSLETFLMKR